jgi:hypothetical protein
MIEYDFTLRDHLENFTDLRNLQQLDLKCANYNLNVSIKDKSQADSYI